MILRNLVYCFGDGIETGKGEIEENYGENTQKSD